MIDMVENYSREYPGGDGDDNSQKIELFESDRENYPTTETRDPLDLDVSLSRQKSKMYPKKKKALIFGYLGYAYQGSQRNPEALTIESLLMESLCSIGAIDPCNAGSYKKVNWNGCARTDKGVSAVANVISLSLRMVPNIIERANEILPADIRLFGIESVSKRFHCRSRVDGRRYVYVMPAHLLELSELGKSNLEKQLGSTTVESWNFSNSVEYSKKVLQRFIGSRNYHHFTSSMKYNKSQAYRVVRSFDITKVELVDGVQWVTFSITGQSFVLNQIRKMIALIVCIVRDYQPAELVDCLFTDVNISGIHIAPSEGLFLEECIFDNYNSTVKPPSGPLLWNEQRPIFTKFRDQVIIPSIYKKESDSKVFSNWVKEIAKYPLDYEKILVEGKNLIQLKEQVKSEFLAKRDAFRDPSKNNQFNTSANNIVTH